MKQIEEIEMRSPDGWHPSYILSRFVGTGFITVRDLKSVVRKNMLYYGMHGLRYFRVRLAGRPWRYFTVDM